MSSRSSPPANGAATTVFWNNNLSCSLKIRFRRLRNGSGYLKPTLAEDAPEAEPDVWYQKDRSLERRCHGNDQASQ
jgi:hypothetical protein